MVKKAAEKETKATGARTKKIATKTEKKSASASSKQKTSTSKKAPNMTSRQKSIQQIRQDLFSQRESLLKEAEETLNALPGEINFPDMGDQATAEADRNFMLRLRDRERMLLKKIEETIERIDHSDYGICKECENEIGIKRLVARPVATYCIECKTRQEEDERLSEGS